MESSIPLRFLHRREWRVWAKREPSAAFAVLQTLWSCLRPKLDDRTDGEERDDRHDPRAQDDPITSTAGRQLISLPRIWKAPTGRALMPKPLPEPCPDYAAPRHLLLRRRLEPSRPGSSSRRASRRGHRTRSSANRSETGKIQPRNRKALGSWHWLRGRHSPGEDWPRPDLRRPRWRLAPRLGRSVRRGVKPRQAMRVGDRLPLSDSAQAPRMFTGDPAESPERWMLESIARPTTAEPA